MSDYDIGEFLRIAEKRLKQEFVDNFRDKDNNFHYGWSNQDARGFETLNRFFLGYLVEMHNYTEDKQLYDK